MLDKGFVEQSAKTEKVITRKNKIIAIGESVGRSFRMKFKTYVHSQASKSKDFVNINLESDVKDEINIEQQIVSTENQDVGDDRFSDEDAEDRDSSLKNKPKRRIQYQRIQRGLRD